MQSWSDDIQQQAAVFNAIGADYEVMFGNNQDQQDLSQWLADLLEPNSKVLDSGCGTGIPTAQTLAKAGHEVTCLEISAAMLNLARQNVPNGKYVLDSVNHVNFEPASFDAVVSFFALLMLRRSDIEHALQQFHHWLKPAGLLLLSMVEGDFDYIQIVLGDQPVFVTAYPQAQLEALITKSGFQILETRLQHYVPHHGATPETQIFIVAQRD